MTPGFSLFVVVVATTIGLFLTTMLAVSVFAAILRHKRKRRALHGFDLLFALLFAISVSAGLGLGLIRLMGPKT